MLPTAGCARHSSGLSVQTFLRGIHVVDYDEAALKDVSGYVITLAKAENLPVARRGGAAEVRDVTSGQEGARLDDLPLREDLRGKSPYGAPQLHGSGAAQHQREPASPRPRRSSTT